MASRPMPRASATSYSCRRSQPRVSASERAVSRISAALVSDMAITSPASMAGPRRPAAQRDGWRTCVSRRSVPISTPCGAGRAGRPAQRSGTGAGAAPPGLAGQGVLDLLLLTRQFTVPFLGLGVDELFQGLLAAHRAQQVVLQALQVLLGGGQLAALQVDHLVQVGLVLLLVEAVQAGFRAAHVLAQPVQTADVVAVALAQVALVLHATKHLAHPHMANGGQLAEGVQLILHQRLPSNCCSVCTLNARSASWPVSWRRKRSMAGASCTARSVLGSAPGV